MGGLAADFLKPGLSTRRFFKLNFCRARLVEMVELSPRSRQSANIQEVRAAFIA
jgi:hypothetical protein